MSRNAGEHQQCLVWPFPCLQKHTRRMRDWAETNQKNLQKYISKSSWSEYEVNRVQWRQRESQKLSKIDPTEVGESLKNTKQTNRGENIASSAEVITHLMSLMSLRKSYWARYRHWNSSVIKVHFFLLRNCKGNCYMKYLCCIWHGSWLQTVFNYI